MPEEYITVPAVNRAIDILEYVAQSPSSVTTKDLCDALQIPTSTCFRIIKNLLARGFLIEDRNTQGKYSIGFQLIRLADQTMYKLDLRTIALPFMRQISIETNQAVQLGVLESAGVVYIEQSLPLHPVSAIAESHTPVPINICAAGKVLCAYMPLYKQADYLRRANLAKNTQYSITDKEILAEKLQTVLTNGYGTDEQEFSIGVGCVAVPIFNYTGRCVAAIGTTGNFADYNTPEKIEKILKALRPISNEISFQLGYHS